MQPLFTHNRLYLGVWLASLLLWRVLETSVDIRTFKRLRAGIQRQDQGSHVVLLVLVVFGVLLGLLLAFKVQVFAITSGNVFLFWLGLLLIYAGMALRFYAIAVLGAFFTTTVAIAPEAARDRSGSLPTHSASFLYRFPHHITRIGTQLDELVESARHYGMCAAWRELPYPCRRARPPGAAGPALSGVYAAHETAYPLCVVTEDQALLHRAPRILLCSCCLT